MTAQNKGIWLVMLGTLLFSSKAIVVKFLYQYGISPLELQTLRMLIVLPFYIGILLWAVRKSGLGEVTLRELLACVIAGIACYHIASFLDLQGLLYISAGLERIILFCYPAIAMLFGWWLLREKPNRGLWLALALSYSGIIIFFFADLSFGGEHLLWGSLLVFIASILTAWYMVANQIYSRKLGSQRFICFAMIAASVSLLIHSGVAGTTGLTSLSQQEYVGAAVIAIFCTLIPSFMVSAGVKIIGASKAGIVGTIGPLATIIFSNLLLNEPLGWLHFAGLTLVILGMRQLRNN